MSARTAALRNASAAVVAAAIAGTVLMPLAAHAAEGDRKVLKTTMSAPVPSGPLTRGGATETFELTVANTADKDSLYHPWMLLDPTGASPLQKSDVVYKVEPLSAPATEVLIGQQDGGWQGTFYPTGTTPAEGFLIPAGGKLTWKVTIGLGKSYPTTNGDFQLRASSSQNEIADGATGSLTFKTDPAAKTGKLENWFDNVTPCQGSTAPDCQEMDLRYRVTGEGDFNTALATSLQVDMADLAAADLQVRVKVDGQWKDLKGGSNYESLPVIPKGFGAASGVRVTHLQVKLGPKSQLKKVTPVKLTSTVGLAEGNTYPFGGAEQKIQLAPKTTPTSPAPTTPAPTSPSPTTPAPAGSAATTPATTATPTTANNPAATGSLAHTGADSNTGLYTGLAAALIALGGAAAWLGARRRKSVRG